MRPPLPALLLTAGCLPGPRQLALPPTLEIPVSDVASTRLLLVGDTGAVRGELPGDPARCDPDEAALVISADCRARLQGAMAAAQPDAVLALGDLVYFSGPSCPPAGLTEPARATLDRVLGDYLGGLGAPVLLALGNHDLAQRASKPASLRCYVDYAAAHPTVELPERTWLARLDDALVVVLDTNRPPRGPLVDELAAAIDAHRAAHADGWVVFAGHHPYRTWRDNGARPQKMRRWVRRTGLVPDLFAQGHAHFLQHVVLDGVPAVTSGAGAKAYRIAACREGEGRCGEGERFSWPSWGYVVAHLSDEALRLDFHDVSGGLLWSWTRDHADPEGSP